MYPNITYLAQSYFHPDYQDDADEPIEIVEKFRDSEDADVIEALRAEIVALIESGATEDDLSRIWLDEAGSYYDPSYDEITTRDWLLSVLEVLGREAVPADADAAAPPENTAETSDPGAGIPFKGSAQA